MSMPKRLVLVRHGQSEANVVQKSRKVAGFKEPELHRTTPDREIRLTDLGREQTVKTAEFLKKEYPLGVDSYYSSDHIRARETAALVCMKALWPEVKISIEHHFGERHWGNYNHEDDNKKDAIRLARDRDPLNSIMPNGETLGEARGRTRILLEKCARQHSGEVVIVFTHGEYIECVWSEIDHMRTEQQRSFFAGPGGDMKNCQIVEFESENGKFVRYRSSNPHAGYVGEGINLEKKKFTPEEILKEVNDNYFSIFREEE